MRSNLTSAYGLPVVHADNALQTAASRGISPWQLVEKGPLDEYLAALDRDDPIRGEVARFGPKTEVSFWTLPDGKPFRGYATIGRDWVTPYVELPHPGRQSDPLVPLTMEFKHGMKDISVAPPSGVPDTKKGEGPDDYEVCAVRCFFAETGIELAAVRLIAVPKAVSGRQCDQRYIPALGEVKLPISVGEADPVSSKYLRVVLIPRSELLLLLQKTGEACADSVVLQAFMRMGLLDHVINPVI